MQRWFEAYPELFEEEQRGLEAVGFMLDEAEVERGRVVFRGEIEAQSERVALTIVYPDSFPFLRPEVFASELRLGRHQNPFRGNLCLLDRSTRAWDVDDTGAALISEQVPHLLNILSEGGDALREAEVPQGEPLSRFFVAVRGTGVFIPEPMLHLPPDVRAGSLQLAVGHGEQASAQIRACLSKVNGGTQGKHAGPALAALDGALAQRFNRTVAQGSWVRLDSFPDERGQATDLLDAARAVEGYEEPPWQRVADGRVKVVGVVAPEEVRHGEFEDSWLFACRFRHEGKDHPYVVRGERLGLTHLSARIPSLEGMRGKSVALAGLGALGAPLALELARALVGELRLLDHDEVETGTTVRWPLGITAAGHQKTEVVAHTIRMNWPLTAVETVDRQIGLAAHPDEIAQAEQAGQEVDSEADVLTRFLGDVHLLIEATAELGIQQFLARQADDLGLPQVYVWMTEGGWGGVVARVLPGETGCWFCLQLHLDRGTISLPPFEETGRVQPRGCAFPTFTGSSFDALPLIAQAARVATRTLLHSRDGGPEARDVFVCSQRLEDDGLVAAPSWESFALTEHEECPYCGGERA